MVATVLSEIPNIEVCPLKYGRFDALRFWFPIWTRDATTLHGRSLDIPVVQDCQQVESLMAHSLRPRQVFAGEDVRGRSQFWHLRNRQHPHR